MISLSRRKRDQIVYRPRYEKPCLPSKCTLCFVHCCQDIESRRPCTLLAATACHSARRISASKSTGRCSCRVVALPGPLSHPSNGCRIPHVCPRYSRRACSGEFDHDMIHGEGLWVWPDGSSYAGRASHGRREGKGLYVTKMRVSQSFRAAKFRYY